MFAKSANFKPFAAIKGSERKQTLKKIASKFDVDIDGRETSLMPKTVQSARCALHSGMLAQIYSDDGHPLWITIKDTLIPTVYMLQLQPDLLPVVWTVPNTLGYLQNGADFMTPGIFGENAKAGKGSPVQIRSLDGKLMAVGIALINLETVKEGDKGKAVEVVNVVGDTLVPSLPAGGAPPGAGPAGGAADGSGSGSGSGAEAEAGATAGEAGAAAGETDAAAGEEDEELTIEEADDAFNYALGKVLSVTHTYPMPSATFAALLDENLPYSHPDLSIKNTSFKKLAKFLKHAEKEGKLTLKDKKGDISIQSAKQVTDNLPPAPKKRVPAAQLEKQAAKGTMDAKLFYKPRSLARAVLEPHSIDQYYTAGELKKLVEEYISKEKLATGKQVAVDDNLRRALGMKQDVTETTREKIMPAFLNNCNPFHTIQRVDDDAPPKMLKGGIPQIEISTERRGGNKVVTKITGLEKFLLDPKAVAERLRHACAGSTTVQEIRTGLQVVVQGEHVQKTANELEKQGIRPAWIKR